MSRKREPVAEIGAEDYRIVRHTHDVTEATIRMRALLGDHSEVGCDETCPPCPVVQLGKPVQLYIRIQGALPNSYAAAEGWRFAYVEHSQPGRGRFPAVVFR